MTGNVRTPMQKRLHVLIVVTAIVVSFLPTPAQQPPAATPGTESGLATFQTRCSVCHNNPVPGAPTASAIRELTPERIYDSVATGSMQKYVEGLSDIQKRRVA